MTEREMVVQFHEARGLPVRTTPTMPSEAERLLRCRLLLEEVLEFIKASGCTLLATGEIISTDEPDLAAMAHENADVRVITHGNDLTMGAPPDVYAEVMRANMSKLGDDGKPVLRADGKVMKGPNYKPPDVAAVLARASGTCACGHAIRLHMPNNGACCAWGEENSAGERGPCLCQRARR